MTKRIGSVLSTGIERGQAPGCVAMVVDRTSTRYASAFGVRDLATAAPMQVDTMFRLASMTKAITSAAAMQLVERGKLTLDTPVAKVLPEFGALGVLTGFYGDTPAIRPPSHPVTLRHLLTHTSGLGYEFWSAPLTQWLKVTGTPGILSGQLSTLRTPLLHDPGAAWTYGRGTDWVGRMVEATSGQTLDTYVQHHLLTPLGMHETSFDPSPALTPRMAELAIRDASGGLAPLPFEWPAGHELWNGGHRLHSTAADYARFLQMLLNGGTFHGARVLESNTVERMGQNHIGDLWVTNLRTVQPAYTNDAEFFPGMRKKHGLGYMINCEQWPNRRAIGSGCWAGVFNTYFWFDPAHGLAGLLMTQVLPFADHGTMALLDAFEEAVYTEFGR